MLDTLISGGSSLGKYSDVVSVVLVFVVLILVAMVLDKLRRAKAEAFYSKCRCGRGADATIGAMYTGSAGDGPAPRFVPDGIPPVPIQGNMTAKGYELSPEQQEAYGSLSFGGSFGGNDGSDGYDAYAQM